MVLRAARRRKLPKTAFAYPRQRKYPIDTLRRAKNALSRVGNPGTFGTYAHVARAVKRKWGAKVAAVGGPKGKISSPGTRKSVRRRKRST